MTGFKPSFQANAWAQRLDSQSISYLLEVVWGCYQTLKSILYILALKTHYFFNARPTCWAFCPSAGHGLFASPVLLVLIAKNFGFMSHLDKRELGTKSPGVSSLPLIPTERHPSWTRHHDRRNKNSLTTPQLLVKLQTKLLFQSRLRKKHSNKTKLKSVFSFLIESYPTILI